MVTYRMKQKINIKISDSPLLIQKRTAKGKSEITGASRLRLKESDRLNSTAKLIRNLGGMVVEHPDGLTVFGRGTLYGGTVDSCNDHRIAMSAAFASCLCSSAVTVTGAECVAKSYPVFWHDFENLKPVLLSGRRK